MREELDPYENDEGVSKTELFFYYLLVIPAFMIGLFAIIFSKITEKTRNIFKGEKK